MSARRPDPEWSPVCRLGELQVGRGVSALVHGHAVALFRTDDDVHALGAHDPVARTPPLARGIVGRRAGVSFVASVQHRRSFDLHTGRCLEHPHLSVPVYDVEVVDGVVLVGRRRAV